MCLLKNAIFGPKKVIPSLVAALSPYQFVIVFKKHCQGFMPDLEYVGEFKSLALMWMS